MSSIGALLDRARGRRLGFAMDEVMSGEHRFEPGCGPRGPHPMEFDVTWSAPDLREFLTPGGDHFMSTDLEGTVTIGGLCTGAPCRGTLSFHYVPDRLIRYEFTFEHDGRGYRYVGEKVNILPWNLAFSHTTCFGTLTETDGGRLVSRSVTHFRVWRAPGFLASLRLTSTE